MVTIPHSKFHSDFPLGIQQNLQELMEESKDLKGCGTALEPFVSLSKLTLSTPSICEMSTDSGTIKLESIPILFEGECKF